MVAGLSFMVWMWAMRRPSDGARASEQAERPSPVYVAVGAHVALGSGGGGEIGGEWVDLLRAKMPEGTRLVMLGRRDITLGELNQVEIPAVVAAKPDIVTIWSVVTDATKGVALQAYIKELHLALATLTKRTEAEIVVLNLPDISLLARGGDGEKQALIRGGVEQWNKAIAGAVGKYRGRVRLVDVVPISKEILGVGEEDSTGRELKGDVLADKVWDSIVGAAG
jgi:hypothetical protein